MKKMILILALLLAIVICFVACGKDDTSKETETTGSDTSADTSGFSPIDPSGLEIVVGGYTTEETVAGTLPEKAQSAFEKAVSGLGGVSYKPLACIGKKVVAGSEYAILVKSAAVVPGAKESLRILFIVAPISGEPELIDSVDFELTDYIDKTGEMPEESMTGSWSVPMDGGMTMMPQELASAASGAFLEYKEISFEPLCCVGTQVVAGTNYALVCRGTKEGKAGLYMVVVFDPLTFPARVISVCPIDIATLLIK